MLHAPCRYFIRKFGCGLNFDTGTHETYHKLVVNEPYAADCHREEGMEDRLARDANTRILIRTVLDEGIPDPTPRRVGMTVLSPHVDGNVRDFLGGLDPQSSGDAILRCVMRCQTLREATTVPVEQVHCNSGACRVQAGSKSDARVGCMYMKYCFDHSLSIPSQILGGMAV